MSDITLLLIVFTALIGGCISQDRKVTVKAPVSESSPAVGAQITTTPPLTAMLPSVVRQGQHITFSDPILGIELNVPGDWSVLPRSEAITGSWMAYRGFSSPCSSSAPIMMSPCTGIDIVPGPSPIQSLDEIEGKLVPVGSKVFAKKQVDLNGLPALSDSRPSGRE